MYIYRFTIVILQIYTFLSWLMWMILGLECGNLTHFSIKCFLVMQMLSNGSLEEFIFISLYCIYTIH